MALRATLIASVVLLAFTAFGQALLAQLGVSIPALQTAGGIILGLIAIDMIFGGLSGGTKLSPLEGEEAANKEDLAVFPLATPLLAGPGAMSAGILLAANAAGNPADLLGVYIGLIAVMFLTLALLCVAPELSRVMGITAQRVMMRVFGILLGGIAVQALFDGLSASGLFGAA